MIPEPESRKVVDARFEQSTEPDGWKTIRWSDFLGAEAIMRLRQYIRTEKHGLFIASSGEASRAP
jgi:hypothetical protein